jgi:hypothetical protein
VGFYWLEGRNRAEIEAMKAVSTEAFPEYAGFGREGPRQRRFGRCRLQ